MNLMREITEVMRCKDPWLKAFLTDCRNGDQSLDMYYFTHGYPTFQVGSWMPGAARPLCDSDACVRLIEETWLAMAKDGRWSWDDMQALERDICKTEKARRARVMHADDDRHTRDPFVGAPYTHPYNAPTYNALQLRSLEFASARG